MTGILDQLSSKGLKFRVRSVDDVMAILLARALDDMDALGLYTKVVPLYSHAVVADAAKRMIERGTMTKPMFQGFYHTLTHDRFRGSGKAPELVAIRIERTSVGMAGLLGGRLLWKETKHLRSKDEEAEQSVCALIQRLSEDNPDATLCVESRQDEGTRRSRLNAAGVATLRQTGMSLRTVSQADLYAAYGVPACETREEMRSVVAALYLELCCGARRPEEVDAVAAGLLGAMLSHLNLEDREVAAR